MANGNDLNDSATYRNALMVTDVFKNTSGAARFFAYVGPNGKELASGAVELVQGNFVHPMGILEKQAILRDLAAGSVRYGKNGIRLYTISGLTGTTAGSAIVQQGGRVVGAWFIPVSGTAGNGTITATTTAGSLVATVAGTQIGDTANKVKELTIVAAGQDVVAGDTITATPAIGANTARVVIAVAEHG
jgi:hypothetical protein